MNFNMVKIFDNDFCLKYEPLQYMGFEWIGNQTAKPQKLPSSDWCKCVYFSDGERLDLVEL